MTQNNLTSNFIQTEFSVSEISSKIKYLLENNWGTVRIKGEISGLKIASSGHGYFSLKDTNAVLAATCWRYVLSKIQFKLEEGLEVIVTGKITAYASQSKYQISAEGIKPAGDGAFMKILKERRLKLENEGLFAKDKKQSLPFLPKKIGIVTSITGAVIKDMIHRISDRCPTHLCIWPVSVQGKTSADEIANAVNGFNQLSEDQKPDLLIVARGGGSIEDLWSFNEEIVVRSVYASKIPIISAVGHETDFTLIDFVSDVRAPTPTAAAEFAVPVIDTLKYTLESLAKRIHNKLHNLLRYYFEKLHHTNRLLNQSLTEIRNHAQRIDELSLRLAEAVPNLVKNKELALRYINVGQLSPTKILNYKYLQYKHYSEDLVRAKDLIINQKEKKLELAVSLIAKLDYNSILKRGYAIIKNEKEKYVSSISELQNYSKLYLIMQDGELLIDIKNAKLTQKSLKINLQDRDDE